MQRPGAKAKSDSTTHGVTGCNVRPSDNPTSLAFSCLAVRAPGLRNAFYNFDARLTTLKRVL